MSKSTTQAVGHPEYFGGRCYDCGSPKERGHHDTCPWYARRVIVNTCATCGRQYTLEEFRELPLQRAEVFDAPPWRLELRNCACGSTHAIWTDLDGTFTEPSDAVEVST